MTNTNTSARTGYLVRISSLVAIMLLLEATGLGMIHVGVLELTILQIPVVIGAIILGPSAGALLGGVFGAISFWECFGRSAFGAALLAINPLSTFIVCFVPRILMGFLCGLIFKALYSIDKTKLLSFAGSSLAGALLNTVLFMTALMLLFGNDPFILNMRGGLGLLPFLVAFVGLQGLVEAIVCFLVGAAVSKALIHFLPISKKR
ncbi:MAG: ECF transporter S component [Oscillospiraceae bacterium]